MATNEELSWECGMGFYVPILNDGELVGICKPEYAEEILEVMNEQERLRKALRLACLDLLRRVGGKRSRVNDLMQKYIALAERPKYGPRAVALLLRERQEQLQVSGHEFIKFCDIHKISPEQLKDIYAGKAVDTNLVGPIARILGKTNNEVQEILEGPSE
ncbi:MAG: hypothetical protein F6K54_29360 [Okeania sp. SIO3B5]|uniref:hypothetical protein n=1 Tax=Okeania sp. SIO3B5 TaxID=2607811 RepID=UPI0013FF5E58|nr:hypothetical protein [Okeania sp. SIO3B5]NEO56821.1 hypothetical protein [Okeania sp. SIO3B5]